LYADALIGPNTVDTMPRETLEAFRDHGKVAATIEQDLDGARAIMAGLAEVGIDMKAVTDQLENEGVDKFAQSFDELLAGIVAKRDALAARA
jgi:transaldolase